ncbi:sulfatase-like hydrolase/transferase [Cyclobacterium marinum]|uniref:Sulfatase n=1 Tax=Cyclobacterium marinum (strain ATCC 25205 / DSM 745 / LMG 13164 / NCIMB 1802) TaxID=880070 RepID=G0J2Q0_CYCMS|nr:sulfatase-like hydrolase/transferase [Cyclobacterium marinum]AEL26633.1 sulfatase [Cyclobacterium marinum DSM 745]
MLKNLICQIALPALLFLFSGLTQAVNAQNNWSQNNTVTKSENGKTLPNVVIILADDMGYSDLQGYGGGANTPNLDALASEGVKFTNCYAGAPNCSPSRVGLLTGRIPARAGMYSYRPPGSPMHLPDNEITIAELLKPAGYQTAHFGKWHLSVLPQDPDLNQPQPNQQGFDYSLGTENNAQPSHLNPVNFIRNGTPIGEQKGYSCQLVADEVDLWFKQKYQKEKPFFLYVAFHEPHAKVASPDDLIANYPGYDKKTAEYFANIENMDLAAGRVLEALKSRGLDKNTMVFFASDNGPYRMGSQGELRGLKGEVYDGGIKVPGIFSYPGAFPGKREIETPIWFQDLLPTIGELAGAAIPSDRKYDGINLLPLLEGGEIERDKPMLWYFYRSSPEVAMRKGDYMLMARANDEMPRTHGVTDKDMEFIKTINPEYFELYNVANDAGQQEDLSTIEPEKLEEMKSAMFTLLEEVKEEGPNWEGLPIYEEKKANHNKPEEFKRNQKRFLMEGNE